MYKNCDGMENLSDIFIVRSKFHQFVNTRFDYLYCCHILLLHNIKVKEKQYTFFDVMKSTPNVREINKNQSLIRTNDCLAFPTRTLKLSNTNVSSFSFKN